MYYHEYVWLASAVIVATYYKLSNGRFVGNTLLREVVYPKDLVWC